MNVCKRLGVSLIVVAGLSFMGMSAASLAQGPKKNQKKDEPIPAGRINWHEKKIAFEMRGKEWRTVFEWLADQTGMPYASPYPAPGGTFTFINPTIDGKPREYTLADAFDIINEILQGSTKHTLIRRDVTLTMFPADAEIPEFYFPQVDPKDLATRSKTEIVRTIITVTTQDVDLIAGQVKKWLGDFGHVTPLPETNQLIMRGTVQSLILTQKILFPKEGGDVNPHTHTHKCTYMRAREAAAILTQSLGQAQSIIIQTGTGGTTPTVSADGAGGGGFQFGGKGKGGGGGDFGGGFGGGGGGTKSQHFVKPHTVTYDKITNTVIINGPTDKINQAKEILAKIDIARFPGDTGLLVGPVELQNHDLPAGSAETTAKLLTEVYKDDPTVRIQVSGPSRLFVSADPQTHWDLAKIIQKQFQPTLLKAELIQLFRLDPTAFSDSLKAMMKDGPYIEADKDHNGIRVRGTEEQIKEARSIIKVYDENPLGGNASNIRMINLDKGSGATVAEALFLLMPKLRQGDYKIVVPSRLDTPDFRDKKDKKDKENPEPKKTEEKKIGSSSRLTPDTVRELMYVNDPRTGRSTYTSQIEKEGGKKGTPGTPGKKVPTIIISGFGNRVVITSDDPEAHRPGPANGAHPRQHRGGPGRFRSGPAAGCQCRGSRQDPG